jgi:hypothetical protein
MLSDGLLAAFIRITHTHGVQSALQLFGATTSKWITAVVIVAMR